MTLLRMPNNGAKEEQGTAVIVYGTEINTFNLIARLPQEKLKKVRDATSAALGSNTSACLIFVLASDVCLFTLRSFAWAELLWKLWDFLGLSFALVSDR